MLSRLLGLGRKYPVRAVLVMSLALGTLAAGLPRLQSRMDPYADGGSSSSSQRWLALEEKEFRDAHGILLFVELPGRSWTDREICAIELWAEKWAQTDPGVHGWMTPLRVRRAKREGERLLFPRVIDWDCHRPETLSGKAWDDDLRKIDAPPWRNFLAGKPNEYAIQFTFDDRKTASGEFSNDDVRRAYRALNSWTRENHADARVILAGPSAFSFFLEETLTGDAWVPLFLLILLALCLRAFLGTWRASIVYAGSLTITFSGLFGVMGWLGLPINVLTHSLVLMTAIAGIEDFIFLSAARASGLRDGKEYAHVATPGFWTTLTTAIGFWSLGVSDVAIIRDFGWAAGFGALLEWAVLFLVLPAFTGVLPWLEDWVQPGRAWIKLRPRGLSFRTRALPWAITLGGIAAGLAAFEFVVYDETPSRNFPAEHPQALAGEFLRNSRGWTGQIDMLFPIGDDGKRIDEVRYSELVDRAARVKGVRQVHDERTFFEFFTMGLSASDASAVRDEYEGTKLKDAYRSREGTRRAFLMTEPESVLDLKALATELRAICKPPECALAGKAVSYLDVTDDVVDTLLKSFLTSLFWVSVLVLGLAGWHRTGSYAPLILSALWGPFVMIALVSIFKIEMNLITCLFAAVIVGLSGDNAIHFIFASRGKGLREGTLSAGAASIVLALTLAICSLTMFAQTLRPLNILGGLLAAAFLLSLFGEFGLVTALLEGNEAGLRDPTAERFHPDKTRRNQEP